MDKCNEVVKLEVVRKHAKVERLQDGLFHVRLNDKNYLVSKYGLKWHCACPNHTQSEADCEHIRITKTWLASKRVASKSDKLNFGQDQFQVIVGRFDQLEARMQTLISKILDEINNGHKPKNLPLNDFSQHSAR